MCRKKGKLPHNTLSQEYNLEYGTATIEIHTDAVNKNVVDFMKHAGIVNTEKDFGRIVDIIESETEVKKRRSSSIQSLEVDLDEYN